MTKKRKPRRSGAPRPAAGLRPSGGSGSTAARRTAPLRGSERATDDGPLEAVASQNGAEPAELEPADTAAHETPVPPTARKRPARTAASGRDAADRPDLPRGLFGGFRGYSPYPRFRESIARGALAAVSSPVLVLATLVVPVLFWLAFIGAGLDHVPQGLADVLAIPPIGSFLDFQLSLQLAGLELGTLALYAIALTIARAFVWAVLIGLTLEWLEGGRPSPVGALRGILRFPTVLAVTVLDLAIVFFAQTLGGSLGSLGSLAFFASLVGGLYFLVFAPIAAIRSRIPAREAIRRSVRASRLPGSRHVGVVLLYFTISFLPFMVLPGPLVANPSIRQWALILVMSLVHLVFMATFAFRYMAVEDEIPEPAPRQARAARPGQRRRFF